jgi:FkbM family methyltransferase
MNMAANLVTLRDHTFFASALNRQSIVVDAGGNRGDFAQGIAQRFGCRVLVLEPVPELFESIPAGANVQKFPCALTPESGTFQLNVARNPEANSLRPLRPEEMVAAIEVRGVSLADFMREQGLEHIDLWKIDVEGAEIDILLRLEERTLSKVSQITVEFHAHTLELLSNREEETRKVREVIARLQRLGFSVLNRSSPFYIDVLFVNRTALGLSAFEAARLQFQHQWWHRVREGIARRLKPRPAA